MSSALASAAAMPAAPAVRAPASALARTLAGALVALSVVMVYMMVVVFEAAFPPVVVFTALAALTGLGALASKKWAPAFGTVYALAFLGMNAPFLAYDLTRIDSPAFAPVFFALALCAVALVAGASALVQNYRVAPEARRRPSWLVPGVSGVVGACLAAVAIAALPQPGAAAGVSADALAALPAVEFRNFEFTQKEIRVKAGEQVALRVVNVDAMPHSFDIDELDVHAPIPANGSGLALFRAGKPGRYTVYCAPHYDRKSGQGMKATLIVE
jgi:plastocyanin